MNNFFTYVVIIFWFSLLEKVHTNLLFLGKIQLSFCCLHYIRWSQNFLFPEFPVWDRVDFRWGLLPHSFPASSANPEMPSTNRRKLMTIVVAKASYEITRKPQDKEMKRIVQFSLIEVFFNSILKWDTSFVWTFKSFDRTICKLFHSTKEMLGVIFN